MIVDTSALVAVVVREPGFETILDKLAVTGVVGIGTPTIVELGIVLSARLGTDSRHLVLSLLDQLEIAEVSFGERHWREALRAYLNFGRGRHGAGLNLGDCFTYAVASLASEPLLFTGEDFAQTDLQAA